MLKHQFRLDYFGYQYRAAVLEVERLSFDRPWNLGRLSNETRPPGRNTVVSLYRGEPFDYVLFDTGTELTSLSILRLAVHPEMRRQGMGRQFVELYQRRCRELGRSEITANVPERSLGMQMLLKACGMECEIILRGWDEETNEDLYRFVWTASATAGKEVAA